MTAATDNDKASPADFVASDEMPICMTDAAVTAAKEAIASEGVEYGLRVSIIGGGCSGYQYNLDFEQEPRDGDTLMNFDGLTVYLDSISVGYLKGTVIDYLSGIHGTGFKFSNPNARRTCGCGSSCG